MPIDWSTPQGGGSERLDEGTYLVRVKRILLRNRDGEALVSKDGAPRIGVVLDCPEKNAAHTAYVSCGGTLSWTFVGLLTAVTTPEDRIEMDTAGVELGHFAEESGEVAAKYLLGRWCIVTLTRNGNYLNARYRPADVPQDAPQPPPAPAPRPSAPPPASPGRPIPGRLPPPKPLGPKPQPKYDDDVPF